MGNTFAVARRELTGYFATPVGYVFIVFVFHPWLYLLLVPAVSMRLWAEERKTGTDELLLTLPLSPTQAVIGKFLAAWAFIAIALALTFPMWITVNVLGQPDNGVIAASYLGSLLMAGAFLAIGSCMSALTNNQVVAFILAAAICFVLTMSGLDLVLDWVRRVASSGVVDFVANLSFLEHFGAITKGVVNLRDLVFFVSTIVFWLFATVVAVDARRGA